MDSSFHAGYSAVLQNALPLESFGLTDIGRARASNQDYFALRPRLGLFTVGDGMGGHAGGEVASRLVLECVCDAIEHPQAGWAPGARPASRTSGRARFEEALQLANRRLLLQVSNQPQLAGMGTTFAGLFFCGERAVIAHVGDSRVYRLRGRTLSQMTEDHSLFNDHLRAGLARPDEEHLFPYRNVITRAVGVDANLEVDVRIDAPEPGDVYLLCSDGLSGVVARSEILELLRTERDLGRVARRLVQRANALGGPDNITAVLVRVADARAGLHRARRSN